MSAVSPGFDDTLPAAANEAAATAVDLGGRRLVIRADGDARIGIGHVMRCLALSEAWIAAGGLVRLACTAVPPTVAERYVAAGAEVSLREMWPPDMVPDGADAIVVDGAGIPDADIAMLANGSVPLVMIDDSADRAAYPARIVLNQNLHATRDMYRGKTTARLCLGPDWCLLRREFLNGGSAARTIPEQVATILILMGGADPHGYSSLVLEATADAVDRMDGDPEIALVVGAANPAISELERQAAALPARVAVRHDVRDMAQLLARADLAISAAGSTVWEMATLGLPMIIGAQNDMEVGPAEAMARHGAARNIGRLDLLDTLIVSETVRALATASDERRRMSVAARRLVDGNGANRAVAAIAEEIMAQGGSS
jgi:UDP-2,4-diacetamido-2,4,6-trideoxy-beta-L-altropyranose hydrolase